MPTDETLFPDGLLIVADPGPPLPQPSPAARLRDRQANRITAGWHPLAYGGAMVQLHPSAARPTENDGRARDPYRCGSCRYRVLTGGHAKAYAKCLYGRTVTPIPEERRVPGGPTRRVVTPRVTNGSASDVRAWWPGCTDWAPAAETETGSAPDAGGPAAVAAVIEAGRYSWNTEDDLQAAIALHLSVAGHDARREVRLTGADRIDILAGRVGVEVKVTGSPAAVARQLQRYARSPDVDALVLATTRPQHRAEIPAVIGGKPVLIVVITGGAW